MRADSAGALRFRRGVPACAALAGAVAFCATLACEDKKGEPATEPAASDARLDAARKLVGDFESRLSALYAAVTKGDAGASLPPCGADSFAALDGGDGRLLLAESEFLERYARPSADPYAGARARWRFLTTPALRAMPAPSRQVDESKLTEAAWNVKKLRQTYAYLGVVHVTARKPPRLQGEQYQAGELAARILVAPLKGGDPLCRIDVQAQSSDGVAGIEGQSREDALWNNYVLEIRKAIESAVSGASRAVSVELG